MTTIDLGLWADEFAGHVQRLWPDETLDQRAMCLAEEAGEVCRAITKRRHARDDGTCKGMTPDDWTEKLRMELGQTLGVALSILHREGLDPLEALHDCLIDLEERPTVIRDSTLNARNQSRPDVPTLSPQDVARYHREHHGGSIAACGAAECQAVTMLSG